MESALDQSVFQAMVAHFSLLPVIDLLATPLDSKLPLLIIPFPDLAVFGIDTLSVPWDSFWMAYAFPPTALVCDMLMKLQGLDLILIMVAPWSLDLLELSLNHPVELPVTQTSLTQPVGEGVGRVFQKNLFWNSHFHFLP